ncbi:MAG: Mur ligase family protein, partial [Acidimicrobiales bacterium]
MSDLTASAWIASGCAWASVAPAGARWLRVAQREHYLPGASARFAARWWFGLRRNVPLALLALVAAGFSWRFSLAALGTAAVGTLGPVGLSVRGRTSPLVWTRRLRSLAVMWLSGEVIVAAIGFVAGRPALFAAIAVLLVAPMVDLACLVMLPLERRMGARFVALASVRLRSVNPTIVGITGSYGKTSTKNYVAHLLGGTFRILASPASFNNSAGLARAVNENLAEGTEVFVAEMGTYGPGEIRALCEWCPPEIAVLT